MLLSEIDKNFAVDVSIDKTGLTFYDVDQAPFKIYGVKREKDYYTRVPIHIAETVSVQVLANARKTAGGRIRFVTDSARIAIIAKFWEIPENSPHMTFASKAAVDIYEGETFMQTFMPPAQLQTGVFESVRTFEPGEKVITLNMPPYGALGQLFVGIDEGATLKEAPEYTYEKPVVYYGSSITQGGCVSRPGTAYPAILSRRLDCDFINLGFSGGARGEKGIVDFMANIPRMSAFVCDYDHNAPDPAYLEETHEPLYRAVRAKHPDVPILFVTRPSVVPLGEREQRLAVIKATYDKAVAEGDQNVYFFDCSRFFPHIGQEHTVDNCHLTDWGFRLMADGLEPTLREILEKNK